MNVRGLWFCALVLAASVSTVLAQEQKPIKWTLDRVNAATLESIAVDGFDNYSRGTEEVLGSDHVVLLLNLALLHSLLVLHAGGLHDLEYI